MVRFTVAFVLSSAVAVLISKGGGLNNRIEQSIARLNVREFHGMINQVTAEHLGMIQVLGYLLGAIVGTLQQVAALLAH